jgi:hypothetical protein
MLDYLERSALPKGNVEEVYLRVLRTQLGIRCHENKILKAAQATQDD